MPGPLSGRVPPILEASLTNMKFATLIAALLSLATLNVVAEVLPVAVKRNEGSLLPRAVAGLTLCTGTNFGGQCQSYSPSTDTCYVSYRSTPHMPSVLTIFLLKSVPDPYQTDLFSSRTSSGYVCFLYAGDNCGGGCEACVDSQGWGDMGSVSIHPVIRVNLLNVFQFAAVGSMRCVVADAAGCSNANCVHH